VTPAGDEQFEVSAQKVAGASLHAGAAVRAHEAGGADSAARPVARLA
jgi:hypothetical protein